MGNRLKEFRIREGLSRQELEAASNVNCRDIAAIEDDPEYTPGTKTLERLAGALGSTVDQIFFGQLCN